jgi:hypothetical protein
MLYRSRLGLHFTFDSQKSLKLGKFLRMTNVEWMLHRYQRKGALSGEMVRLSD